MLLHGHFQPLQRLQPQLRSFFHQHYLGGQEPTPGNIRVNEGPGHQSFPSFPPPFLNPACLFVSESSASAQALDLEEMGGTKPVMFPYRWQPTH